MKNRLGVISLTMASVLALILVPGSLGANGTPVIDGVISVGEWDAYYLGTSNTTWQGGMSVDVYGFADNTYLYVAYEADKLQPGWAVADSLNIGSNFYYSTVKDGSLLDTVFHMENAGETWQVMQTSDWVTWDEKGTLADVGVEFGYTSMWDDTNPDKWGVAELKIPLSLIAIAGANQVELYGQYWQYDWSSLFYVTLPPPTRASILGESGVPGQGLGRAPGLQKPFNPNSNAPGNIGGK